MAGDISLRVALDEEVEVSRVHIAADGGVRSHDFLVLGLVGLGVCHVKVGGEGNVLANGKAEDGLFCGKLEAVDGGVVGGLGFLGDGEFGEGVGGNADVGIGGCCGFLADFLGGCLGGWWCG